MCIVTSPSSSASSPNKISINKFAGTGGVAVYLTGLTEFPRVRLYTYSSPIDGSEKLSSLILIASIGSMLRVTSAGSLSAS